ncbi:MAG TPA: aminotransferase class I/II-fold pyridoxal phosphate-dependent enzyme [Gemmatimonadales bacterium]|nr:aminotransferase class I/II-fold pyridoxal phosphate-dependent enzyme [Gemmatimonadales bacterium]
MTAWRHQVPVHSPLSMAALLAGARAAVAHNGGSARAEEHVVELLKERYSAMAVLLTESGTAALTAALHGALRDRPGAAVALPAYACYDLATAAEGAGVSVFLYDVDPHTLAPDLAQLRAALNQGAAAVVVVHLYGYPVDLAQVSAVAAETGAVVIEDAAQAAGAVVKDRPAGTQGSLTVLSFGRGKGLTGGSGGALLANDDVGEQVLARERRLLGPSRRGWPDLLAIAARLLLEHPNLYGLPAALPFLRLGETIYREPRRPRAPTRVSCPVISATWTLAEREVEVRRCNAERLLIELRRQPAFETISAPPNARPGYLRLPVLASPAARCSATDTAARRLGVMPGYPSPLSDLERLASHCVNRNASFPGGRALATRLFTLPTHGRLGVHDLERLEQWIRTVGGRGGAGAVTREAANSGD